MKKDKKRITPRKPNFQFNVEQVPKHWLNESAFKTHLLNSFTLIFPVGERYFIRSINKVLKKIDSKELLEEAQNFIRQEAQHALEHGKFLEILKEQGYDFDHSLDLAEKLIEKILEPLNGEALNLSITAGLEHLTALLSEISLSENFVKDAPSNIRDLYNWHAAEEIEHRAVAYDVLQETFPNMPLRFFGLIYAYAILSGLAAFFTAKLLHQEGLLFDQKVWKDFLQTFFFKEKLFFKAVKIFSEYLTPHFHPLNSDLDILAEKIFGDPLIWGKPA